MLDRATDTDRQSETAVNNAAKKQRKIHVEDKCEQAQDGKEEGMERVV